MATGAPDHYKAILLYGLYDGTPVPLACDEYGRLILKLQPPPPYDTLATVVFQSNLEEGLVRFNSLTFGTGAAVEIEENEAASGALSAKLTGGSDSARTARITPVVTGIVSGRIGVQFSARFGANVERFNVHVRVYDGDYEYQYEIRYVPASDHWQLNQGPVLGWATFLENVVYVEKANYWYTFKLVCNLDNRRYHSFQHAGGKIDLSSYSHVYGANTDPPIIYVNFTVVSDDGQNGVVYLDDIIITQGEPE